MNQISIFDWMRIPEPGETTKDKSRAGKRLTWEEACAKIGRVIWMRVQMNGWHYYKAIRPEKHLIKAIPYYKLGDDGEYCEKMSDRLICYAGRKERCLIDEWSHSIQYKYPETNSFWEVKI